MQDTSGSYRFGPDVSRKEGCHEAKKIAKVLSDKHGCKKVRIQVLDLAQNPADIFKSDKIFNK